MIRCVTVKNISEGLSCLKKYLRSREEKLLRSVVFAEDRLTLIVEKAICEELGGSMLSDVTTFSRYIKRRDERVLSKQASVIKVGEIMISEKENLSCFNKDYSAKTAARSVYETIAQFAACSITSDMLDNCKIEDAALAVKISDISLIYRRYVEFLENEGYADENSMLAYLPSTIRADKNSDAFVFFAFGSFTAQAKAGLKAAMECSKDVLGIFLSGEEEFYTREGEQLFLKVAEESGRAREYSFPTEYDDLRNTLSKAAFNPEIFRQPPIKSDRIKIYECPSPEEEVTLAAALIKKLVADGMRFKDITLFLPDIQEYYPEIDKIFSEYSIPYFADIKRNLSTHPIAKFLIYAFRAADENLLPSAVDDLLSCAFFEEFGEYRNYLSRYANYRGGVRAEIKSDEILEKSGYDGEYLRNCRERVLKIFSAIKPKESGKNYCKTARWLLSDAKAEVLAEEMSEYIKDVSMQGYLNQITGVTDKILTELESISGDTIFTAGDFCDLIVSGFSATEISIIPLKADAVFIGDIHSSKVDDSEAVIAIGMSDKVPAYSKDIALISDRDILKLKGKDIDVAPLISEVNMRLRESVAVNLLSFKRQLFITYPISSSGEERSGSELLNYFMRAVTPDGAGRLKPEKNYTLFPYDCCEFQPARRQLYLRRGEAGAEYAAIAHLLEEKGVPVYTEEVKQEISTGEYFFGGLSGEISPTVIESFNECPYRNFAEHALRLKERDEGIIKLSDSGTVIHEILKEVSEGIRDGRITTREECKQQSLIVGRDILSRPEFKSLNDTSSDSYYAMQIITDGANISLGMYSQLEGKNFTLKEIEKSCRLKDLHIKGRFDRLDVSEEFMRIIDYKTGNIDDSLSSYYAGVKLQLQLYMLSATEEYRDKQPAGLFYFPARINFSKPDEIPFALRGFIANSSEVIGESEGITGKCIKIPPDKFRSFLKYSEKMAIASRQKLREGFIRPSPFEDTCRYCKYGGMCGYSGEGRKYSRITAADIIRIAEEE